MRTASKTFHTSPKTVRPSVRDAVLVFGVRVALRIMSMEIGFSDGNANQVAVIDLLSRLW
jgi:hypothetical protein